MNIANNNDYTVLRKEKMLCPICCAEHDVEHRYREGGAIVRSKQVRFVEEYYACTLSDEDENEFVTGEMLDQNLWRARLVYDREYGRLNNGGAT